jgi:hypothetical protein
MSERTESGRKPATALALQLTRAPFGSLQRKCACGGTGSLGGECADCKKKTLQRSAATGAGPATVPPIVHDVLRSPGQPLDAAPRSFFEPRFGHDFSKVRVHTDGKAAESVRRVEARAYAFGHHIVFAVPSHPLDSAEGARLMAHELTHVVQQSRTSDSEAPLRVGEIGSPSEREADRAADAVLSNQPDPRLTSLAERLIQRDAAPGSETSATSFCGTDGRLLTPDERSVAEFVFGQSLNPDRICIRESSVMSAGGYVRTVPVSAKDGSLLSIIYVAPGTKNAISKSLLIHELTHCAQYQHGVPLLVTLPYAIWAHYDYGDEQGLLDAIKNKKCFDHFNTEQQADIVKDYYLRVVSNKTTYPWDVFVNQVRAQGACIWPNQPTPAPVEPYSPGSATA